MYNRASQQPVVSKFREAEGLLVQSRCFLLLCIKVTARMQADSDSWARVLENEENELPRCFFLHYIAFPLSHRLAPLLESRWQEVSQMVYEMHVCQSQSTERPNHSCLTEMKCITFVIHRNMFSGLTSFMLVTQGAQSSRPQQGQIQVSINSAVVQIFAWWLSTSRHTSTSNSLFRQTKLDCWAWTCSFKSNGR